MCFKLFIFFQSRNTSSYYFFLSNILPILINVWSLFATSVCWLFQFWIQNWFRIKSKVISLANLSVIQCEKNLLINFNMRTDRGNVFALPKDVYYFNIYYSLFPQNTSLLRKPNTVKQFICN